MHLQSAARYAVLGQRARARIRRAGRTAAGYPLWTKEEDEIVRANYPDISYIKKLLPHRTRGAVKTRGGNLGVSKKCRRWTAADRTKLRKMLGTECTYREIAKAFDMKLANLHFMVRYFGLKKKKRRYRLTGVPLIDIIHERTYRRGWTLKELDEIAGTRKYFATNAWRDASELNGKYVMKAITALGGEISVRWED